MTGPIEGATRHRTLPVIHKPESPWKQRTADLGLALLYLLALASFSYTIATAPWMGKDLIYYRTVAASWAAGTYLPDTGRFYGPPPWTAVALSPASLLQPSQAVIFMLLVNLAAAATVAWLALALWGQNWGRRGKLFLCALLLVWAPFRITVRNGQLSLIITALVLGYIWARKQRREYVAGALLGLSLIKYPLSFPFLLYSLWRREWKTAGVALGIPLILTLVYAARLEISPIRIASDYIADIVGNLTVKETAFTGTTEIKPLVDYFVGEHRWLAMPVIITVWISALLALGFAFRRARTWEAAHFAALSLFSLWVVFHRPYDSVLLIIPAAVLIDLRGQPDAKRAAEWGLGLLGLFALSIPGILADRLGLDPTAVASNPLGLAGLHLERLVVLGLFSLMILLMIRFPAFHEHVDPMDPLEFGHSPASLPPAVR
jgi:hypothetical protein